MTSLVRPPCRENHRSSSRDVISQPCSPGWGNPYHNRQPCTWREQRSAVWSRSERHSTVFRTVSHSAAPSSLILIKTSRDARPRTNIVRFATWNIQFGNNKVDDVCDVMSQFHIHVIALTETWREDSDCVCTAWDSMCLRRRDRWSTLSASLITGELWSLPNA